MKLEFSVNEEKKGIELYFDEELSVTQQQRLRELGFRRAKDFHAIGFRTQKQDLVKWYIKDHPAYREYAENLQKALDQNHPPIEEVAIYPSYKASEDHIKNNRFSIVTIRFKEGESYQEDHYVVFDQFVRIARDVANRYGWLKYGDRLLEVKAFSKTQKTHARALLKQGKVLDGRGEQDSLLEDSTSQTKEESFKEVSGLALDKSVESQEEVSSDQQGETSTIEPSIEYVEIPITDDLLFTASILLKRLESGEYRFGLHYSKRFEREEEVKFSPEDGDIFLSRQEALEVAVADLLIRLESMKEKASIVLEDPQVHNENLDDVAKNISIWAQQNNINPNFEIHLKENSQTENQTDKTDFARDTEDHQSGQIDQVEKQEDQKETPHYKTVDHAAQAVDIINSKGEEVINLWPPKGVNKLFVSHRIHKKNLDKLKASASSRLWKLTDENLPDASAQELFELIQFGHPDQFEIEVSRQALLPEWIKRGEAIFTALGFPTDLDYPYVSIHTGYGRLESLGEVLGDRMKWWSVAEHWRPIGDVEKAIPILDGLFENLLQQQKELINPKTQKPFGKNKDEYNHLEWEKSQLHKGKALILSYLDKTDLPSEQNEAAEETLPGESSDKMEERPAPKAKREKPTEDTPALPPKQDFKKLKAFADFLDKHEVIDGWMNEGATKKEFARKGKAAFKELATYLGFVDFKIDFSAAGPAMSGDLSMSGMVSENQGIYISLSRDGMGNPKALYRSIQHLKDHSGGSNQFFLTKLFENPIQLKETLLRLVKPETEEKEEEKKASGNDATQSTPLEKLLGFIHQHDEGKEWTPKQLERFHELAKSAFEYLAHFLGLTDIQVWTLSEVSIHGMVLLKGTFINDIGMQLSYAKKVKGPSQLIFDYFDSTSQDIEVLSEKMLETPDILKKTVIRFLQQKVKQKEKKVDVKDELHFLQDFLYWFESKDQHLPAHQITRAFLEKWCKDHHPNLSKNWIDAGWELWEKHIQLLAKVTDLSNGKLSPNLQRHFNLLQKSEIVFDTDDPTIEHFKRWVKQHYPWFTDDQVEIAAEEKVKNDQLKAEVEEEYKRKHIRRIPIHEIHLSIDRKEGLLEFDFTDAEIFHDWKAANAFVEKLSRALVPSFAARLVWEDGFGVSIEQLVTPTSPKSKEPFNDLIFNNFFEVFYYSQAWPEEVSAHATKIIEKYELYEWEEQEWVAPVDYLDQVIAQMHDLYYQGKRATPKQIEKLAQTLNVPTMGDMWEAVELSWMLWYRSIYLDSTPFENRLERMIHFWNTVQPTYTYADSSKVLYQQYSTSCPIGAIIAEYTGMSDATRIFEPSAGNGLLVVGADPQKTHVNEIDSSRLKSLKFQGFHKITELDATQPFPDEWTKYYDVVVTNPPFTPWEEDKWDKEYLIDKYFHGQIGLAKHIRLEHLMAGLALHTLKDDGKAAIIIMGHIYFKDGLIAKYRPFFNWLYRHYQVDDVINLNSFKLYNKQGAVARTMLILINGRKPKPEGVAPQETQAPYLSSIEDSFESLWQRVGSFLQPTTAQDRLSLILEQLKIELS